MKNAFQVQDRVISTLRDNNIPFIIYGGTTILGKRAVSIDDVDVIVRKEDWESGKVDKLMYGMGSPNYIAFVFEKKFKIDGVPVELKWQTHPMLCDDKTLWNDCLKEIEINGEKVKTFNDIFNVVFLCTHAYKHIVSGNTKPRNLEDIAKFIKVNEININDVVILAKKLGRLEIVQSVLALTKDFYKIDIPDFEHSYTREQILYPKQHTTPADKITMSFLSKEEQKMYKQMLKYPDPRMFNKIYGYGSVSIT